MVIVTDLLDAIVTAYQHVPEVLVAMAGNTEAIYSYSPKRPDEDTYEDHLDSMNWPAMLISHTNTELGFRGNYTQWRHTFRVDVKLGDEYTYPYMQKWLVDGTPTSGDGLTIMQCSFDDHCDSLEAPVFTYQRDHQGRFFLRFEFALQERVSYP